MLVKGLQLEITGFVDVELFLLDHTSIFMDVTNKTLMIANESNTVKTYKLHSPREIISTMGKTGQDARRKRKPCRKVFIPYQ